MRKSVRANSRSKEGEEGGLGARANASCEIDQALEKAQNGNGQLLEKVGMDLGLAPCPLGFGATPVWDSRGAEASMSIAGNATANA
jgi:hypothetical protein